MNKKGFTLIEIVITMALVFLMVGVVDGMLISYLKGYKSSVVQSNGSNYLNEALVTIEKEVNSKASEVKTDGNIISIKYYEGNSPKYIKCINGKISIFYNVGSWNNHNTIIDDVKDFVAIRSGKILYIKVTWNNGQSIERCLAIENAN